MMTSRELPTDPKKRPKDWVSSIFPTPPTLETERHDDLAAADAVVVSSKGTRVSGTGDGRMSLDQGSSLVCSGNTPIRIAAGKYDVTIAPHSAVLIEKDGADLVLATNLLDHEKIFRDKKSPAPISVTLNRTSGQSSNQGLIIAGTMIFRKDAQNNNMVDTFASPFEMRKYLIGHSLVCSAFRQSEKLGRIDKKATGPDARLNKCMNEIVRATAATGALGLPFRALKTFSLPADIGRKRVTGPAGESSDQPAAGHSED